MPRSFRGRATAPASTHTSVASADSVPLLSRIPSAEAIGLAIGAGRVALGLGFMAAPVLSMRVMGLDTATASRAAWLAQMTAARDLVLGAGTVSSVSRASGAAPWLLAGAVSDAADTVFVGAALRGGKVRGPGAQGMWVAGAVSSAIGVWAALGSLRRR